MKKYLSLLIFVCLVFVSVAQHGKVLESLVFNSQIVSYPVKYSVYLPSDYETSDRSYPVLYLLHGYSEKPKNGVSERWKANSPLYLLDTVDKEQLKSIRFYIDCGDDDFLYKGNSALHVKMRDLEIPHEYRVRNGGHEWPYWRTGLYDGLQFISKSFHR